MATEAPDEPESTAVEPESTAVEDAAPEATAEPKARRLPLVRRHLAAILLTLLLLASAGVAAWLYFFQYRIDQQTDRDAQQVAKEAAETGTVALLSYAPDTMDNDFTAAKTHLTGDFLDYYTQFTQQIVTPAVKEKQVKTSAAVVQAAVAEMHPDSAVVLVFVNQTTVSKENPDGAFAASAVKVGLTKANGRWLINTFDPV
ncbi:twin-arginine translocation pathway signal [Mycobacterium sp. E740]|nr:twin-arginine translocation pathway signal [Mycobacterium sp. E740]